MSEPRSAVTRRGLLVGAAGSAMFLGSVKEAPRAFGASGSAVRPAGVPEGLVSISSAPEPGVSYRFAAWGDMTPLNNLANGRIFQPDGVSATTSDSMGCFFEIPPGALVHDVEAYYSATINTTLTVAVWSSGLANLSHTIAAVQLGPYASQGMHVTKLPVPTSKNGPFPHGCMLAVFIDTLSNQSIQVNGFRVGFTNAPLSPVLLPKPVTVYSSTSYLKAGHTKQISLASHLPIGANGATYTISTSHSHDTGELKAGPAGATPTVNAVSWGHTGDRAVGTLSTPVSAARAIAVHSAGGSGKTRFSVQLTGYLV